MKKKIIVGISLFIILWSSIFYIYFNKSREKISVQALVITTQPNNLIVINGIIRPDNIVNINYDGSLSSKFEIKVSEGSYVNEGDELLIYDISQIYSKIKIIENQIKQKENKLLDLESKLKSNQESKDNTPKEMESADSLTKEIESTVTDQIYAIKNEIDSLYLQINDLKT